MTSEVGSNTSICCVINFGSFLTKHSLHPLSCSPFHCYCIRGIAVATIVASKQVVIVLVVVSLTACRKVTHDVKICPWLNTNVILITMTSVYHCTYVIQLQVIVSDVLNIIAECHWELRWGVFTAVFLKAVHHGEYRCHLQHNFLPIVAFTIKH